jgi:hypothetical protein
MEHPNSKSQTAGTHVHKLKEIHEIHSNKKRRGAKFEIGELVWVYLSKDRYPKGDYNKLTRCKFGPYSIMEKFGKNAFRVKLFENMHISNVFNVRHLHKYHEENTNLRSSFHHPREA